MKIKDLKEKYPLVYEAAMNNRYIQRRKRDDVNLLSCSFIWRDTPEKNTFWYNINLDKFKEAEEICPHLFVKNMETTSPQNNLPKYWVVKRPDNCNSNSDWEKVIDYLNTMHVNRHYTGITHNYYGIDGNSYYSGTSCGNNIMEFQNNPVELSLDEFIRLFEGKDNTEKISALPKYWCVKNPGRGRSDPQWQKVINYLNTTYSRDHDGTAKYYGYEGLDGWGYRDDITQFKNNPTLLTLEQFIEIIEGKINIEKEFVLPENWVIKITKENKSILQKYNNLKVVNYDYSLDGYYGNQCGGSYKIPKNAIEITFEQFQKYVLKEIPKEKPMKEFTPIAMKCNEKEFKAILPKLEQLNLRFYDKIHREYLVNNVDNNKLKISSIGEPYKTSYGRKVYETWNEQIFLESLGIDLSSLYKTDEFEVKVPSKTITLDNAYIVICNDDKETHEVAKYIKGYGNWTHYKYVINHKGLLNNNHTEGNIFNSIPEKVKHLPILSFQEWKDLFPATKPKLEPMKQSINTKTQIEFNALMEYFEKIGIHWGSGNMATDCFYHWEKHKNLTGIQIKLNSCYYGNINSHSEEGYEIISFEDFAKQNNIKIPIQQSTSNKLIINGVEVPQEIVELMLQRQVEQGHLRDITVFQKDYSADKSTGGFTWEYTPEKGNFWNKVLSNQDFNIFFEKYPKKENKRIEEQEKFLGHWLMSPGVRIAHPPYFKADKEKPIKPSECYAPEEPIIIKQQQTTNKLIII